MGVVRVRRLTEIKLSPNSKTKRDKLNLKTMLNSAINLESKYVYHAHVWPYLLWELLRFF